MPALATFVSLLSASTDACLSLERLHSASMSACSGPIRKPLNDGGVLDHLVLGHDEEQDAVGRQLQSFLEQERRRLDGVVGAAQEAGQRRLGPKRLSRAT